MPYHVNELAETQPAVLPPQWAVWDWPRRLNEVIETAQCLTTPMSCLRQAPMSYHVNEFFETGLDDLKRQWAGRD